MWHAFHTSPPQWCALVIIATVRTHCACQHLCAKIKTSNWHSSLDLHSCTQEWCCIKESLLDPIASSLSITLIDLQDISRARKATNDREWNYFYWQSAVWLPRHSLGHFLTKRRNWKLLWSLLILYSACAWLYRIIECINCWLFLIAIVLSVILKWCCKI